MYRDEADALDAEILAIIDRWSRDGKASFDFNGLALRIFAHQLRYNEPYARYCAALGVTAERLPATWEAIPPVPSAAFKEAALCTFDPSAAALVFETSGTTAQKSGRHYMESSALYDAALLAGFRRAVLPDVRAPIRFLNLVPNPSYKPTSSLGYMMKQCAQAFGDGETRWLLHGDELDVDDFVASVRQAEREHVPVCISGTAFAFVQLLDMLIEDHVASLPLVFGSRIMETGGFKGRTRVVDRAEMYRDLAARFALPEHRIIAEYGMTELTSQYYDAAVSGDAAPRVKTSPPWLRPRVVGPDGRTLPDGTVGALAHVDLANRSSCVAIQTEDLGVRSGDGIVLIGREHGAELRGCSLDAEQLRALQNA